MSKIGVFICHCGENISATVDCEKVAEAAKEMEGVAYAIDYKYMCSDPGQSLIRKAIEEGREDIPAQVIRRDGSVHDLLLHVRGLTADEKEILLDGCLMNYYAARIAD